MSKIWKLKPEVPEEYLKTHQTYDDLTLQLLYNRGLTEADKVDDFLHPDYLKLRDPFLFKDMQKAVDRVWQAIEQDERIFIYGDYDADAVTANPVLQQTFRYLGVAVESYIPDRFTEGYGLNLEAFEKIKAAGANLVITVDCGTNSVDAAEFCKKNNIDLIITDHHVIFGQVPDAFALINPKNPDDNYPCQDVTGVGVAYKLASAILKNPKSEIRNPKHNAEWEKWLLDLVAIGTVADCHSLLGENRLLVKYGLKVLPKSKWQGLRALCRVAALDFNLKLPDTYTLGFLIAPRLNAAGRLEHANTALHLLMEKDPIQAQEKAFALNVINQKRQDLTARVLSEAKEKIIPIQDRKVLVLLADGWPKGVVGLVAGRLAEEYGKPTIVLERQDGESTGSARSVGDFNIAEALRFASSHLVKFGGHKQAAGLTLKTSEFESFYQKILEYAETNLSEADLKRTLWLEAELSSANLTVETLKKVEEFAPFGVGNPRPKFLVSECRIINFREVGNSQKHLQLTLQKNNTQIAAIAFNFGYFAKSLKIGDTVDVAAELIEDGWNGREDVKLRIVDIKTALKN